MQKIGFDIKNLWLYGKGIGTFTTNLLLDLNKSSIDINKYEIQLYSPDFNMLGLEYLNHNINGFRKVLTKAPNKLSQLSKLKYDQQTLLACLNINKPEILFSPYFDVPYLWNKPMITTIHDLSILDLKSQYSYLFYQYNSLLLKKCIKQSKFIVTVSDYSKYRIIERFGLKDENVKVIYNKVKPLFNQYDPNTIPSDFAKSTLIRLNLPLEYILYTGGFEMRKNIPLLIHGYLSAAKQTKLPPLVITGIKKDKMISYFMNFFSNHKNIIILDFLEDIELLHIYTGATLIVNTSSYEGFGIPVLEAITLCKPILCSDIPVYKEIGNSLVYYFKNNDVNDFSNQLTCFFKGKFLKHLDNDLKRRADFYNKKNYSELFFNMIDFAL